MMNDLAPIIDKLAPLVRLLASDHDNEALGAARAIGRTLAAHGATFHDLADLIEMPTDARRKHRDHGPIPAWDTMSDDDRRKWVDIAFQAFGVLDEWQIRFVSDVSRLLRSGRPISDRKVEVMNNLFLKLWTRRMVP